MSLTPERINELDAQVREIGKYLGMEFDQEYAERQEGGWNYHAEIKSGDKRISFSTSDFTGKTRLVIRGVFPRDLKGQCQTSYNAKHPEITVAIDRGPEKIAHAIQSRLLPEYERQLVIALKNIAKSDAYHAGRLEILKKVAEYFGQPVPENDDKEIYPGINIGINKIRVVSEGVEFGVFCGIGAALEIFEILRKPEYQKEVKNETSI